VIVPEGTYWIEGPVNLKSNVRLHVSEGATIKFSPEPKHYLPVVLTRWEGTELFNYSPMIYVYQATNVAITGKGTIHGNSETTFATWKPNQDPDQLKLRQMGNDQVPVHERIFGEGHWLRPSMIQFWSCKNVLVEDVTIHDSPFWVIHPIYSTNITVRNVYVDSWNANNDGVDPDSSVNVLVENCRFETGDDSVAIKSGRDQDAWRVG
jgi:polygalacturonase